MTAPHIFNATKINSQLLTGTMFILLSRGAECAVVIPKAIEFNSIVAMDLKVMGEKYILWMICACTRFIQGKVLNDKKPETIVKALHRGWCLPYGYPTIGF